MTRSGTQRGTQGVTRGPGRRVLRLVAGLVLAVVVALVAPRVVDGTDSREGSGSPVSSSGPQAQARAGSGSAAGTDPDSGLPYVAADTLPEQAREVLDEIDDGGPFDYVGKDGSTFGNFEGVLPDEGRGYYREYTVQTPGSADRGARRLVTGDQDRDGLDPQVVYWTDDHYETFSVVRR